MKDLSGIVAKFKVQGTVEEIKPLGTGLINDTYKVNTQEADAPDYVLQRINHAIFQNVEMLQSNIAAVTGHIRTKLTEAEKLTSTARFSLSSPLKKEKLTGSTEKATGVSWYLFRVPKRTRLSIRNIPIMQERLSETFRLCLPTFRKHWDFHNMEFRLKQLRDAVAANAAGRVAEVQYYLDEIEKRADEMCKAERLFREGKLPKRVCHCDTKVNNMMFDEDGKVLCVIDLDTVMPSFIFSDYGDFLRTGANTGDEDDKDLDRVNFNMEIFKAFTKGYLKGAKAFLTPIEIENLPYAAALFPYMQCVRFLADYINGDTYYKIKYPEHNLVRTKAQFKLLQSVEEHTPEMVAFINECLANG